MNLSCRVSTDSGLLEINDGVTFKLDADSTAQRQVQWRRQQVQSPFVHGTFTVRAVMDNVTEIISVLVYGSSNTDLREQLRRLTEAFSQMEYTITWIVDDDTYAWRCTPADYQIDTRREFQHAKMAKATFQVSRYPALIQV
jgi:hypothetical protein